MTDTKSCKIVLLGESGVGKTCIIARFVNDSYNEDQISSLGSSYVGKSMCFNDQYIKFEIWDTAGQERFRSLNKIFYKDSAVAVLVYDITKKRTFTELKKYWYNQLKEHGSSKLIIGIAANKSDLYDEEQVTEEEGRSFAKEIGAVFKSTSTLSNNGIDELFKSIGHKFLDPHYTDQNILPLKKNITLVKEDMKKKNNNLNQSGQKKCC